MQSLSKKRRVSTCISCYNRKQKCNRQYPCNHCTRRRRPEECVYHFPPVTRFPSGLLSVHENHNQASPQVHDPGYHSTNDANALCSGSQSEADGAIHEHKSTLLQSFGYFEDSNSNTMALLKMWDLENTPINDKNMIPPEFVQPVQRELERMPCRQVLDFLIQYFVSELNWMKQLVHTPSFLIRYQQWWLIDRSLSIADVEFAVLILRICLYATQFLPSHAHSSESISGSTLAEIRIACTKVGDRLAKVCVALNWKGSLVRIQHLLFVAIISSCEGRTDQFWEGIGAACQAAQKAGIQNQASETSNNDDELEKEMRRRVFCSLYVLDSHLSRQLDRIPFISRDTVAGMLPRMHLATDENVNVDSGAPELFTERLMQLRLGQFWRRSGPRQNSEYDPTQAELNYEQFCAEYLPSLPPAFALKPDTKWDRSLPRLAMQRQLLHISIYDSVCWNFRPLLLLTPAEILCLPLYKQVLLQSQKRVLAITALRELEAIAALHSMFFRSRTRFGAIIFNTFEATVLLLILCKHSDFPTDVNHNMSHVLGQEHSRLTRSQLIQAAKGGLERLQLLAEVSNMAASGARTVERLLLNVSSGFESSAPSMDSGGSGWGEALPSTLSDFFGFDTDVGYPVSLVPSISDFTAESISLNTPQNSQSHSEIFSSGFVNALALEFEQELL